ncbi:hypothetical protein BGZ80_009184, partial [Entomortierella chlamydospora]
SLSMPAQVVLRQAQLSITELSLDPANGPIWEQLSTLYDPRAHRINLSKAPLVRFAISQDDGGRWIAVELMHHLIGDHSTSDVMMSEIQVELERQYHTLPEPQPFRNMIAQARSGPTDIMHEKFFSNMLSEIDTPALPYGLTDVHRDGVDITESHLS